MGLTDAPAGRLGELAEPSRTVDSCRNGNYEITWTKSILFHNS
jgi:hypothetical protein